MQASPCTTLRCFRTLRCCLNAMNLCEPQRKLCDMKTLRLTNDLGRQTFRQASCIAACRTLKTLAIVNYTLFQ